MIDRIKYMLTEIKKISESEDVYDIEYFIDLSSKVKYTMSANDMKYYNRYLEDKDEDTELHDLLSARYYLLALKMSHLMMSNVVDMYLEEIDKRNYIDIFGYVKGMSVIVDYDIKGNDLEVINNWRISNAFTFNKEEKRVIAKATSKAYDFLDKTNEFISAIDSKIKEIDDKLQRY